MLVTSATTTILFALHSPFFLAKAAQMFSPLGRTETATICRWRCTVYIAHSG